MEGTLERPGNNWPTGCRRAATKKRNIWFFLQLLKWWSNSGHADIDGKMSRQLVAWCGWNCGQLFPHLRGTEEILPEVPMEKSLDISEKVFINCGLMTRLLSPLQRFYVPAIQALLMLCTRTHMRFVQDRECKTASWNSDHFVEYSKAHGNVILLLILKSLLLVLFRAARASNMKSHYGWILFLLTWGVNQVS